MGCELDKVVEAINKVAGEVKDSRAIKQLNELKSDLTKFTTSMEVTKPSRDFSRLRNVINGTKDKELLNGNSEEVATESDNKPISNNTITYLTSNDSKDAIIAPINSKTARKIQGCNK